MEVGGGLIGEAGEAIAVSNSFTAHSFILQQLLKLYFAERYMGMSKIAVLAKPGCEDFLKVCRD